MARAKEVTRIQELIYEMNVGQVMATDIITVDQDSRMSDLRDLLREKRISGVPVVDDDNLVGMVSIEDFNATLDLYKNLYLEGISLYRSKTEDED